MKFPRRLCLGSLRAHAPVRHLVQDSISDPGSKTQKHVFRLFWQKDYAIIFVLCLLWPTRPTSSSWFWPIQEQPFELPLIVPWQPLRTWQQKKQNQFSGRLNPYHIGANVIISSIIDSPIQMDSNSVPVLLKVGVSPLSVREVFGFVIHPSKDVSRSLKTQVVVFNVTLSKKGQSIYISHNMIIQPLIYC